MRTSKLVIFIACVGLLSVSCVSKKKYLDMESSKLRAEQRVRDLTDENQAKADRIAQLIADYEETKTELMGSNAEKDQLISDLNGQINTLANNVQEKDANIEEKIYAFEYEKRQYSQQMEGYKNQIATLQDDKNALSSQVKKLTGDLSEIRFNQNRQKDENSKLEFQLKSKNSTIEELSGQLATLKSQVQKLKVDLQTKDEKIEQLKNNVSLLKSELAK
ncbi:hypothetical protein [Sunxiuqinia rutila]|uniref:hypothetical protein n=1 Tax=Sunxiuqinia rutila TaxID=1397841 RepID=UPI003D360196